MIPPVGENSPLPADAPKERDRASKSEPGGDRSLTFDRALAQNGADRDRTRRPQFSTDNDPPRPEGGKPSDESSDQISERARGMAAADTGPPLDSEVLRDRMGERASPPLMPRQDKVSRQGSEESESGDASNADTGDPGPPGALAGLQAEPLKAPSHRTSVTGDEGDRAPPAIAMPTISRGIRPAVDTPPNHRDPAASNPRGPAAWQGGRGDTVTVTGAQDAMRQSAETLTPTKPQTATDTFTGPKGSEQAAPGATGVLRPVFAPEIASRDQKASSSGKTPLPRLTSTPEAVSPQASAPASAPSGPATATAPRPLPSITAAGAQDGGFSARDALSSDMPLSIMDPGAGRDGLPGSATAPVAMASGSGAAASAAAAPLPASVSHQIVTALSQAGNGQVDLVLSPEELGRVRLSLSASDSGITVHVTAERAETLGLIRRHIDLLAQDFRAIGYDAVSFGFSDQPGAHGGGGANPGTPGTAAPHDPVIGDGSVSRTKRPEIALSTGAKAGLDLRL